MKRRKVNSTMVAELAGVSQSTVSLVANHSPLISRTTSEAVIRSARKLGYPLLPQNRSHCLALLLTTGHSMQHYQSSILSAAFEVFMRRNIRMDILSVSHLETLNERVFSGAVTLSALPGLNRRWQELELNLPLIRLTQKGSPAAGIWSVYNDPEAEVRTILKHLHANGHRKIGMYLRRTKKEEEQLSEQTGKVFRRQLELSGVSSAEQLVSYSEGKHDAGLERRIDSLLEQGITALTVIPGESTLKMLNYLNRHGIRIPKDLSVVTREIPGILDCWDPPLTAYEPDYTAHLERAVDLIEAHYNHQSLKNIAIPGRLIERGSVRKI